MSAVDLTANATVRPAGLDYTPVEAYDWQTDIPADALDAKDFPSIDAWLDACIAQDRPGKIGSGTYSVDGLPRYAPQGIYGYGETPPTFVAENVDCWLYLKDQSVTLKGLAFEGFGQVLGGAVELSDGYPHHSTTKYGFDRFMTPEQGGTALALEGEGATSEVGPAVDISDCIFIDCENAFTFVSDTTQMGRIDFNNNTLTGTYGILDVDSLYWTEVNASGNEWADCVGDRAQPNVKQNGVQTGFKIGLDTSVQMDGHTTKLAIVNNHAHDIQSVGTFQDTNAAVFVDVRGAESAVRGDNVISFNRVEHVKGLKGQEDSNTIYAKAWGLVIEGNVIEDSGSAYVSDKFNGAEATGILVKPLYDGVAKDIEVIGNTFIDMPTIPAGVWPDLAVVKLSEAIGNSSISFNTFIGGGNLSGSSATGIVRWYGDYENARVVGNTFEDIQLGTSDSVITFHQLNSNGVASVEVSNNEVSKAGGAFAGNAQLVHFNGDRPSILLAGHNSVEGGHDLTLSRAATGTAAVHTYKPPTVDLPGTVPVPVVTIALTSSIRENTPAETLVAQVGAAAGAILDVDDPRFVLRDGGLYLRAGQVIDFEASQAISLTVSATMAGQTVQSTVAIPVVDVDEAPTGISVTNIHSVSGVSPTRVAVADIAILDPDLADVFKQNAVAVSDSRFELIEGRLYLKAGVALNTMSASLVAGSTTQKVTVTLTATGAGQSIEATVDIPIGASAPVSGGWAQSAAHTNVITGTGNKDTLQGTAGADLIDGGSREDVMTGGAGDDTYVASGYKDLVIEAAGGGIDTVRLEDDRYFLPEEVENLIALKAGAMLVGNGLSNILTGSTGNEILIGGKGADLLHLGGGSDLVMVAPGDGNDVVTGFAADDRISIAGSTFASFKDVQSALRQVGPDTVLDLGDGTSLRLSGVTASQLTAAQFDLAGLSSVATQSDGTWQQTRGGTAQSELVMGTAANDYVDGKEGGDLMQGGAGNDVYLVDNVADRILEAAGEGLDLVHVRATNYAMDAHVENAVVKSAAGATVIGNASANWIEGASGADVLFGGAGADVILGGGGDDLIAGGQGVDRLTGGAGRDTFAYSTLSDAGDTITDFQTGQDRLDLSALLDEMAGAVSFSAALGGLEVSLTHGGATTLIATLKGVSSLAPGDLIA